MTASAHNLEKAAILLLSLDALEPGVTTKIMSQIGEQRAKAVLQEISRIGKVSTQRRNEVIRDFHAIALGKQYVFGGLDVSKKILMDSFGISKPEEFFNNKTEKFRFLDDVSIEDLHALLERETLQMKVFILQNISPRKAAELLSLFNDPSLSLKLMGPLQLPNPELLYDFELALAAYFNREATEAVTSTTDYLVRLASMVEYMPDNDRQKILADYDKANPTFSKQLRQLVFTFEDFLPLSDEAFQTIIFEVADFRVLALARLQTSEELVQKMNSCMTERTLAIVESESAGLKRKASTEQVEDAKRKMVAIARQLERKGGITLTHGTTQ